MFEYKGWITLEFDPYEEDLLKLKEQVSLLEKHLNNVDPKLPLNNLSIYFFL
ncbi:hypothetical protein [Chryseobacterium phosphatilyticum]|uniref:hypothetical protein n=1 Tax=Chryseobacterium phosphatilyticum TaxID=475075 RepID=UPI001402F4D6|nr:hypothetical protein [Chryseobacterium phosphatilyticum]